MRIAQLIPGTCAIFYCENCIRDDVLASALQRQGHDVLCVPLYMPILGEAASGAGTPIFFGGVNVYLQQKLALFRKTPRWLDSLFDAPGLLKWASSRAGMTNAKDLGETTLSMLCGEDGNQAKELARLVDWLAEGERPDVIVLSNALLLGMARTLREKLRLPVVCLLQDEDGFVDALPEPLRTRVWDTMAARAAEVDGFVAVSEYYAAEMRQRLRLANERVRVVPVGLAPSEREMAPQSGPPAIGYLSRMCPSHGLAELAEAFVEICRRDRVKGVVLRAAGGWTSSDKRYLAGVRRSLERHDLSDRAQFLPNLQGPAREEFLNSLSVLSVPAVEPQSSGVYALEAFASGVPVVLPRHGGAVELIERSGGGVLVEPGDVIALADAIEGLLLDRERAGELGRRGRDAIAGRFGADSMAEGMLEAFNAAVERFSR